MFRTSGRTSQKFLSNTLQYQALGYVIASVWLINGLVCKLLNFIPRHKEIVAQILGEIQADNFILFIGGAEVVLAFWVLLNLQETLTASIQIIIVLIMNILEFVLTPELLLWGKWNLLFALLFCLLIYYKSFVLKARMIHTI